MNKAFKDILIDDAPLGLWKFQILEFAKFCEFKAIKGPKRDDFPLCDCKLFNLQESK